MASSRPASRLMVVAFLVAAMTSPASGAIASLPEARLRVRPDRTWMVDGKVFDMARAGGTLYIGGRFGELLPPRGSSASPIPVHNLAAIDLSTGDPVRSWRPYVSGADAVVEALDVAGDRVYVGGVFGRLEGVPAANLGAVTTVGGDAVPGFSPDVAGAVYALLATRRRLYAGGAFGRVDGVSRAKLAAWELGTGDLSGAWRPRAVGGAVRDLELDRGGGSIFVAGAFWQMVQDGRSRTRESLAKVSTRTGALRRWRTRPGKVGFPQTAWSVGITDRRLHGGFGRGPNFAASFRTADLVGTRVWRYALPGNVQSIELSTDGSRLFLGGHFGLAVGEGRECGKNLRGLVSVRPATGKPFCDWIPQLAPFDSNFDGPWTMMALGRHLWVGGGWRTIGGIEQRGLARFSFR
jgi:hypothetical protein